MLNQYTKIPFSTLSVMIVERIFSGFSMFRLAQIDDPYVTDMEDVSPSDIYSWHGDGHRIYHLSHNWPRHGAGYFYSYHFHEDPFNDSDNSGPDGKGDGAHMEYDAVQYDLY